MNRRHFVQNTFVAAAGIITVGGGMLNLSSCQKTNVEADFILSIKQQLRERIRTKEDSFSFFCSETIAKPVSFENSGGDRNTFLRSFIRSQYVVNTNFNPFDDFFDDLEVANSSDTLAGKKVTLILPLYPQYSFFIKKTTISTPIHFPRNGKDFYMVNQEFISQFLNKYKVNI